jgi:uracil-DNA glycosylase
VPPENKPTPVEIATCRDAYLARRLTGMPKLRGIVLLGRISHESTVRALGQKLSAAPFGHGSRHQIGDLALFDSYHCSRYNTNTGVLTTEMFRKVFANVRTYLDDSNVCT